MELNLIIKNIFDEKELIQTLKDTNYLTKYEVYSPLEIKLLKNFLPSHYNYLARNSFGALDICNSKKAYYNEFESKVCYLSAILDSYIQNNRTTNKDLESKRRSYRKIIKSAKKLNIKFNFKNKKTRNVYIMKENLLDLISTLKLNASDKITIHRKEPSKKYLYVQDLVDLLKDRVVGIVLYGSAVNDEDPTDFDNFLIVEDYALYRTYHMLEKTKLVDKKTGKKVFLNIIKKSAFSNYLILDGFDFKSFCTKNNSDFEVLAKNETFDLDKIIKYLINKDSSKNIKINNKFEKIGKAYKNFEETFFELGSYKANSNIEILYGTATLPIVQEKDTWRRVVSLNTLKLRGLNAVLFNMALGEFSFNTNNDLYVYLLKTPIYILSSILKKVENTLYSKKDLITRLNETYNYNVPQLIESKNYYYNLVSTKVTVNKILNDYSELF